MSVARNYVSVYNEGIQIPEERKKEIWTPMYLIDDSRTKTGTTSGMGLAISAIILKVVSNNKYNEKERQFCEKAGIVFL